MGPCDSGLMINAKRILPIPENDGSKGNGQGSGYRRAEAAPYKFREAYSTMNIPVSKVGGEMDPVTEPIVGWIVHPATEYLFHAAQGRMLLRLGLSPSRSSTSQRKPLIDEYLQQLIARIDEDRIARLHGAFTKLKAAPKSNAMRELLIEALDSFQQVAQLPQQGTTRDCPNAELRCMAFVGMASSYKLLDSKQELIAENMVEAIRADADTTRQWFYEDLVFEIISRFPSLAPGFCTKCGFRNPPEARFCNRDGYPLNSARLSLPLLSQTSTLKVTRARAYPARHATFHINLDGKEIGTIRNGERYMLEIQAGHHIIFLRMKWGSSPPLSFDIDSGEEVRFLCQAIGGICTRSSIALLGGGRKWKPSK